MKKPKTVEIDDVISEKEYKRFLKYGINSSTWYATTYARSTHETRDRLIQKGYPTSSTQVKLEKDGEIKEVVILDEVIENLQSNGILNDQAIVEYAIYAAFTNNQGMSKVLRKLSTRGIDRELIDEEMEKLTESFDEEEQAQAEYDGVDRLASRMVESYAFTKIADPWKRKNKLMTTLVRKGYQFGTVQEWIDENSEYFSN